jgi:hypothetical protein
MIKYLAYLPILRYVYSEALTDVFPEAPIYSVDAQTYYGTQLAPVNHTHDGYAKKLDAQFKGYFSTQDGYTYDYAKAISGNTTFAALHHEHDNLYYRRGSTVKYTYLLGGLSPSEYAKGDHLHDNYALANSWLFENTTGLDLHPASSFSEITHNHDGVYYKINETVADTKLLVDNLNDITNARYYTSGELSEAIHFHSSYMSIVEADTALLPHNLMNSILFSNYIAASATTGIMRLTLDRTTQTFSSPSLIWGKSGSIPTVINDELVLLSSYSKHMNITSPNEVSLDLSTDGTNPQIFTYDSTSMAPSGAHIITAYVAQGRSTTISYKSASDRTPWVMDISRPIYATDGSTDYVSEKCFISIYKDPNVSGGLYTWFITIYAYNHPKMVINDNHIKLLLVG